MAIEVRELNGWKKIQAAYRLTDEECSAPDGFEKALAKIAEDFKEVPLPPRDEANIQVIIKALGSSGPIDCEPQSATVAAKITWQDGVKVPPRKDDLLPVFWNSMFREMVYGK